MAAEYIPTKHGAVIQADSLGEIQEFWKKLCEDFPDNRLKFSNYDEKPNGKMTDCVGSIRISKNACAVKAARRLYENVARVR